MMLASRAPEIRAAVDWYAGHLVIAEYTRRQSTPEWLPLMGEAVAEALDVPKENVHLKERHAGLKELPVSLGARLEARRALLQGPGLEPLGLPSPGIGSLGLHARRQLEALLGRARSRDEDNGEQDGHGCEA